MYTTHLRKVGGSVMLTVPPALLDALHLEPGARVDVTVERGRLIMEAPNRPRYTLRELLAQCDAKAPRPARKDREWLDDLPVGRELL